MYIYIYMYLHLLYLLYLYYQNKVFLPSHHHKGFMATSSLVHIDVRLHVVCIRSVLTLPLEIKCFLLAVYIRAT